MQTVEEKATEIIQALLIKCEARLVKTIKENQRPEKVSDAVNQLQLLNELHRELKKEIENHDSN